MQPATSQDINSGWDINLSLAGITPMYLDEDLGGAVTTKKKNVCWGRVIGTFLKVGGILAIATAIGALASKILVAAIIAIASLTTPVGWAIIGGAGLVMLLAAAILLKERSKSVPVSGFKRRVNLSGF